MPLQQRLWLQVFLPSHFPIDVADVAAAEHLSRTPPLRTHLQKLEKNRTKILANLNACALEDKILKLENT